MKCPVCKHSDFHGRLGQHLYTHSKMEVDNALILNARLLGKVVLRDNIKSRINYWRAQVSKNDRKKPMFSAQELIDEFRYLLR